MPSEVQTTPIVHWWQAPWLKRIALVAIDGLVQAFAVAIMGFFVTALVVALGYIYGPLRERAIGALIGLSFVIVVTGGLLAIQQIRRRIKDAPLPSSSKGWLDYRMEAEIGFEEITRVITRMSTVQSKIAASMNKRTRQIQAEAARGGNTKRLHRISSRTATDLNGYSRKFNQAKAVFEAVSSKAMAGVHGQLDLQATSKDDPPQLLSLRHVFDVMLTNLKMAAESQMQYCASVESIKGMSQVLNIAADYHQSIMLDIIRVMRANAEEIQRVMDRLDERIAKANVTQPMKVNDP